MKRFLRVAYLYLIGFKNADGRLARHFHKVVREAWKPRLFRAWRKGDTAVLTAFKLSMMRIVDITLDGFG